MEVPGAATAVAVIRVAGAATVAAAAATGAEPVIFAPAD
jgi:hypothetical protein